MSGDLDAEVSSRLCSRSPDYVHLLRRCGDERALSQGRRIHDHIRRHYRGARITLLSNLLLEMYGKCGSMEDARQVFDSFFDRNFFSWSLMMSAYAQNGHYQRAVELYWRMSHEGVKIESSVIFVVLLGACSKLGRGVPGKSMHSHILESGFFSDAVHSALITMYARCGSIDCAKREFDRVATSNVVTWNAMVGAYARNGHSTYAIELYQQMVREKLQPSRVTYFSVVEACAGLRNLDLAREIHRRIEGEHELEIDTPLGNALIGMYSKCRSSADAWRVFVQMEGRSVFSWNCMISNFAQQGENRRALELYHQMEPEGIKANLVTFLGALSACSALQDLARGREVHARMAAAGYDSQVVARNSLIHMYSKCGALDTARKIFDETMDRTEVSWNTLMAALAQNGRAAEALDLYRKMDVPPDCFTFTTVLDACSRLRALEQGREIHECIVSSKGVKLDVPTGNALITMYGRCYCLDEARAVFDSMTARDVVTWTAIITAYAQSGDAAAALEIYQQMDIRANAVTLVAVADACCEAKDLVRGRIVHSKALVLKLRIVGSLGNALVNMYGSCGSLMEARKLFDEMRERDLVCWSAMIAAYARHGHSPEAHKLLLELCLDGLEPDHITFVTILFACSHAGLVAEGRYVFLLMTEDYCGTADLQHYQCLVDILARAGWLPQAEELVANMPFEPDYAAWMTLLGSYSTVGDYQRGRETVELAFSLGLIT